MLRAEFYLVRLRLLVEIVRLVSLHGRDIVVSLRGGDKTPEPQVFFFNCMLSSSDGPQTVRWCPNASHHQVSREIIQH